MKVKEVYHTLECIRSPACRAKPRFKKYRFWLKMWTPSRTCTFGPHYSRFHAETTKAPLNHAAWKKQVPRGTRPEPVWWPLFRRPWNAVAGPIERVKNHCSKYLCSNIRVYRLNVNNTDNPGLRRLCHASRLVLCLEGFWMDWRSKWIKILIPQTFISIYNFSIEDHFLHSVFKTPVFQCRFSFLSSASISF